MSSATNELGAVRADSPPEAPHAVRPATRRALTGQRLGLAGLLVVSVLLGTQLAPRRDAPQRVHGPNLGCVDVADETGLRFVGEYGEIYPHGGVNSGTMQRDLGNGAAAGDYDGDGYLDVFLAGQAGRQSRLFRNVPSDTGGRRFIDATEAAGLGGVTSNVRVAQFVDLDGSGRPDLVLAADYRANTAIGGPSRIFRNRGDGTFEDVTAGSGFTPEGYIVGGMTFADFDGSGRQSIYLSYWTQELAGDPGLTRVVGTFPGMNRLYRNLGDFKFEEVTMDVGLGETRADSFTAIFADFTGDRWPDIYQASDHRPDRFFENRGDGTFRDRSREAGILGRAGNSMGVTAADLSGGGSLDLYITQITDPGRRFGNNSGNTLMISRRDGDGTTTFQDDAVARGIEDTAWGWGTAFVDADLNGTLDLFSVQGMRQFVSGDSVYLEHARSKLFINDGTNLAFTAAENTGCDIRGDQRALVVFDYNRDGSPDFLITQVNEPTVLLENLITGPTWLTVAPTGAFDAGVNARVSVTAAGLTVTQIVLAGGSYLAGPPREAYFGLAGAPSADRVTIEWADGTTTQLEDVQANQILRVQKK